MDRREPRLLLAPVGSGRRGRRGWGVAGSLTHLHTRRLAAWGVLGTARTHATIRSGTVISKERVGEYALRFGQVARAARPLSGLSDKFPGPVLNPC
jgi:hypothetical protein